MSKRKNCTIPTWRNLIRISSFTKRSCQVLLQTELKCCENQKSQKLRKVLFEKILTNQVKNEKDTVNHEKDSKTLKKNKQTPQQ